MFWNLVFYEVKFLNQNIQLFTAYLQEHVLSIFSLNSRKQWLYIKKFCWKFYIIKSQNLYYFKKFYIWRILGDILILFQFSRIKRAHLDTCGNTWWQNSLPTKFDVGKLAYQGCYLAGRETNFQTIRLNLWIRL